MCRAQSSALGEDSFFAFRYQRLLFFVGTRHVVPLEVDSADWSAITFPCVSILESLCSNLADPCSAYSAHEFSALSSKRHAKAGLPLDIQVETLVAVFLACFGFVLGSEPLKPISWSTWAGKIEREGGPNPYQALEDRVGFMDIRAKRKEFADWVRDQNGSEKS